RSGKSREEELRILGANGEYHWFLSQAEPLRDSEGQILYWVGVNIDIYERKRASETLDAMRERISRATQSAAITEISASLSQDCAAISGCCSECTSSAQLALVAEHQHSP